MQHRANPPIWLEHEEGMAYSDKDWAENCEESRPTSVKNLEAPFVVRVIPNPANDQVRLVFPEKTSSQWRVTDMTGQLIREGETAGTSISFGTTDVPSGVYFLTCRLASGSVAITKFIINH